MIQTCPNCGYVTTHIKHYMGCNIPKTQWPAEYLPPGSPMPAVSVKVVDQTGIREIPVTSQAAAPTVQGAPEVGPVSEGGYVSLPSDTGPANQDGWDGNLNECPTCQSTFLTRAALEAHVCDHPKPYYLQGGACCKHPEQMHVRDAEGFPPTCMGCPDGADEHEWLPQVHDLGEGPKAGPRTINSTAVICSCGFTAKSMGTLKVHIAKSKLHKAPVTSA